MSKDVLNTAIVVNAIGEDTRIDDTFINSALHEQGINVIPYKLNGDSTDVEFLGGLVGNLEEQSARLRRAPNVSLVTVGPYATAVGFDVAEMKNNLMGVAALAPDILTHHLPRVESLREDGLQIVVFQPVFNDTLSGPRVGLQEMLREDMHILRRSTTVQRVVVTPEIGSAVATFAQRPSTRRGNPLPRA